MGTALVSTHTISLKAKSRLFSKYTLSGRKINDNMGNYVASEFIKELKNNNIQIKGSKILIMGLTFKENCSDVRNEGVIDFLIEKKKHNCKLDLYDPWADKEEIKIIRSYKINSSLNHNTYDGITIAVAHKKFKEMEN